MDTTNLVGIFISQSHSIVYFVQILRLGSLAIESQPELELSGTSEEFADTVLVFHAGELHKDTLGGGKFLDGGLGDTKAVDTTADNLISAIVGILGFFADSLDNLVVGGDFLAGFLNYFVQFILQVAVIEFRIERKGARRVEFLNLIIEQRNEIGVSRLFLGFESRIDGGVDLVVFGIVGQSTDHIGGGDLEHDVHTTLQVKAKVEFPSLTFAVGKAHVNLSIGLVVENLGLFGFHQRIHELHLT